MLETIRQGKRPELDLHRPQELNALIKRCWKHDPEQRPEFPEILHALLAIATGLENNPAATNVYPLGRESEEDVRVRQSIADNLLQLQKPIVAKFEISYQECPPW